MKTVTHLVWISVIAAVMAGCSTPAAPSENNQMEKPTVKLITLDPGHFHAALVQKTMPGDVDSVVSVYAPGGPELQAHLDLIRQYNSRPDQPTHWSEQVYTGPDFLEKMISEKKGNVVVLAGNNLRKTQYITRSVEAGLHVLADKPMAIDQANFRALEKDFSTAAEHRLLLYDIMTERSEITNILQRKFAQMPELFGVLKAGSEKEPGVTIGSVHYFYKFVSGNALVRPAWFFDPAQQGETIADVGVHLADLVQWVCFPDTVIDYKKDIRIQAARIWPTPITQSQFRDVTKSAVFPDFLKPYVVKDSILQTHGNGEINYSLKGVWVRLTARWDYKAPEGSGDSYTCTLRGTRANLEIRQGAVESFKPTLYIVPATASSLSDSAVQQAIEVVDRDYPGVKAEKAGKAWRIDIPEKFKLGHEAHFAQVLQRYLQYLKTGHLPDWEVPGMLAKYFTTTKALEMATAHKP